jgi:hypothetical protein
MAKEAPAMHAVQSNATTSSVGEKVWPTTVVTSTRAGPTIAQSATSVVEQTGRLLEKEGSALHMAGKALLGATPPPRTEVPEVERVEGDTSAASLGNMVLPRANMELL